MISAMILAAVVVPGGATASSAQARVAGPPDTYVTDWDLVGSQAFTAAGLSPPEGHTIFAYVAIAVYDSVMAIEGGYEPFANDVDAPAGASAQAAVAASAANRSAAVPNRDAAVAAASSDRDAAASASSGDWSAASSASAFPCLVRYLTQLSSPKRTHGRRSASGFRHFVDFDGSGRNT